MNEFFWPEGKRPGWAMRWSVCDIEAHVEVCTATSSQRDDGEWVEDIVLSDGGYARMWAEDLQLGWANGIAELVPLFDYLYRRAEELLSRR